MAKKKKKNNLERLMDKLTEDRSTEIGNSKKEFLERAVAHSSIYVIEDAEGQNHIASFDKHVRSQIGSNLRPFDALSILHQESAYANFEAFMTQFHVQGGVTPALIHLQGKMKHASKSDKAELHETRKELAEAKAKLEAVRKTIISIKLDDAPIHILKKLQKAISCT